MSLKGIRWLLNGLEAYLESLQSKTQAYAENIVFVKSTQIFA